MASESTQYTLVGFSAELDWRPMRFVKPLPPNRLCGACGLVRKKTAFLPCIHVLCESCYEQSGQGRLRACPLDGYEFQEEDVEWRECPAEELLRREVACWNKEWGCETVAVASDIIGHYQRDCEHHSVSCPKCSTRILCSAVGSHLRSDCCSQAKSAECEHHEPLAYKDVKGYFDSFRATFEKQAEEIRAVLQRMLVGSATHGDRLDEISQGVNTFKDILEKEVVVRTACNQDILAERIRDLTTCLQEAEKTWNSQTNSGSNLSLSTKAENALADKVAKATRVPLDHIIESAASIKAQLKEDNGKALDNMREVLRHVQLQVTVVHFTVPGVQALREKALKDRSAQYNTQLVYLRGYHVMPGICIEKDGKCLKLSPKVNLFKGDMDDYVCWPFQHKVRLSIAHPRGDSGRQGISERINSSKNYKKPDESSNTGIYFSTLAFSFSDLFTEGYVERDNLRVQFELLPLHEFGQEQPSLGI